MELSAYLDWFLKHAKTESLTHAERRYHPVGRSVGYFQFEYVPSMRSNIYVFPQPNVFVMSLDFVVSVSSE